MTQINEEWVVKTTTLLIEADSLLSLILYRESKGLSDLTKKEVSQLIIDIRRWTKDD